MEDKKINEIFDKITSLKNEYKNSLHTGNNKLFAESKNHEILKKNYNKFIYNLITIQKIIKNSFIQNYCTNKLLNYYDIFTKYKKDFYKHEKNELINLVDDITTVFKIDNHIHVSALMTSSELKDYMINHQLIEDNINISKLNTIIDQKPFDKCNSKFDFEDFNKKYFIGMNGNQDPLKNLRQCFLKTNYSSSGYILNEIDTSDKNLNINSLGKYNCNTSHFANLIKIICKKREISNIHLDLRLSIYGKDKSELENISKWFLTNDLHLIKNVTWFLQIPRIPHIILKKNFENTQTDYFKIFIEWLNNIFIPIKLAYSANNQDIVTFLNLVSGFDCVDNEEEPDNNYYRNLDTNIDNQKINYEFKNNNNPFTYSMYLFFIWYFIVDLNKSLENIRPVFKFCPHSGEIGFSHHLISAYFLSDSICHGINLINNDGKVYQDPRDILKYNQNNVLLYLYCKSKIGCAMTPISNHFLTRDSRCLYIDVLFNCGLKLSIGTDNPLMLHLSENPLLEEYINAKNIFNFSLIDLMELVSNSYIINGIFNYEINIKNRLYIRDYLYQKIFA
jgi:AMP deaminase